MAPRSKIGGTWDNEASFDLRISTLACDWLEVAMGAHPPTHLLTQPFVMRGLFHPPGGGWPASRTEKAQVLGAPERGWSAFCNDVRPSLAEDGIVWFSQLLNHALTRAVMKTTHAKYIGASYEPCAPTSRDEKGWAYEEATD